MDPSQRLRGGSAQWPRLGEGGGCSRLPSQVPQVSQLESLGLHLAVLEAKSKRKPSPRTSLPEGAYGSRIVFSTAAQ